MSIYVYLLRDGVDCTTRRDSAAAMSRLIVAVNDITLDVVVVAAKKTTICVVLVPSDAPL